MQRSLREDVERLATWIKIVNIWAVPVLVALLAIGRRAGAPRPDRARRARAAPTSRTAREGAMP